MCESTPCKAGGNDLAPAQDVATGERALKEDISLHSDFASVSAGTYSNANMSYRVQDTFCPFSMYYIPNIPRQNDRPQIKD